MVPLAVTLFVALLCVLVFAAAFFVTDRAIDWWRHR